MFVLDGFELLTALVAFPVAKTFELRSMTFALLSAISRHEAELLHEKGWCVGKCTKHGLRYLQLNVETGRALQMLRRMVRDRARTIAEDNTTVRREEGRMSYAFRNDMTTAWFRGEHWSDWGARGFGPRAIVVVPRHA